MRRRTVPSTLRQRLRSEKNKAVARKLQARKDDFDSKEGPNDEPEIEVEETPEPESTESIAEEPEPEKTPVDPERNRVVDDGSEGKTAAQLKRKKLSKAEVAAATKFAKAQLAKSGGNTKGTDAQVQARFRAENHTIAIAREAEGLKRAKSIGASSALVAGRAKNKAQLTAQAKARVSATANAAKAKASAATKAKVASTVSAAKAAVTAKAKAAVAAKAAPVRTGSQPVSHAPAPKPKPAPPKKPPVKKVGGGKHLI